MRDDRFSINIPKHWLRRAVIALAVGMLVLPAAAWAGHQFTDVPNSNIFHDDIDWMADNDVTLGCNPPANTEYCPEDNVTREQMAAFLHRMDTEGVFATPDEVDALTHFAVINGNDATVIASDTTVETAHVGQGQYGLDFGTDISDCSWTGTVGDRGGDGGGATPNAVVTLNQGADNEKIFAIVTDGNGTNLDEDFSVTVNCANDA